MKLAQVVLDQILVHMLLTLTNNVARNANMSMTESDNDFITPENVPNRKTKKLLAKIDDESDDEMSEEGKTESRPVKTNANKALLVNEVIQFLKNANTKYKRYSTRQKKVHVLYKRNVYKTNRFIFVSVAFAF